jgi:hypothetical protein
VDHDTDPSLPPFDVSDDVARGDELRGDESRGQERSGQEPSAPERRRQSPPAPDWPDLELELPGQEGASDGASPGPSPGLSPGLSPGPDKKESLVRPRRREIVVEVGQRGAKPRRRRTYSPEELVTKPGMGPPGRAGGGDRSR